MWVNKLSPELHADLLGHHACPLERPFFVVAVGETSGSTDISTLYQVPRILQETGWEIFTNRAEEDRS